MRRAALLLGLLAAGGASWAAAPETSLRPVARPAAAGAPRLASAEPGPALIRPLARPAGLAPGIAPETAPELTPAPVRGDAVAPAPEPGRIEQPRRGLLASLRPLLRPSGVKRQGQERKQELARGAICGDAAIQGEEVGRVPGKISGCGIEEAVKVRSIDGIALSQHALMDCETARTIKAWLQRGMAPAVGSYGGGVAQLRVAAHYSCRPRNNQKGARISEHGKGHAIDIAGFTLRDGKSITVQSDWGGGQKGRILSQMHSSACGPFRTVLGPGSDGYHEDHFHFDTARSRSSSYCR